MIVISWEDKDDIQKILTILEWDTVEALNNALEYKFVLEFFNTSIERVNKAPHFWCEVLTSLRYSLLMRTARLVDESKDAVGILKVLNMLEQSKYRELLGERIEKFRAEYNKQKALINEIRDFRDKMYAHNDKKMYKNFENFRDDILDSNLWEEIESLLRWLKSMILELRCAYGDEVPIHYEISNDIYKLW